jgi:hypothetical protein
LATVPIHSSQRDYAVAFALALLALKLQKGLSFSAWK